MQAITDILVSILNPKATGRTLSKRSVGAIVSSFLVLVVLYVIIFGSWYGSIAGEFVDISLRLAKPMLPTFNIVNGRLSMLSQEPFIITHEDLYAVIKESIAELSTSRFKNVDMAAIEESLDASGANKQSFCLVMDTTGTYREKINPETYSQYVVITEDTMESVDRVKTMPGNVVPLSENITEDVNFSPDNIDAVSGPMKRTTGIFIFLGLLLVKPGHFLVKALIAAFIVWLLFLVMKKERPFTEIFKTALYSLSPVVLLAFLLRFGVPIPGFVFQIVYFAYIIMAVSAISRPAAQPDNRTGDISPGA